jgi:hypothetical protein
MNSLVIRLTCFLISCVFARVFCDWFVMTGVYGQYEDYWEQRMDILKVFVGLVVFILMY